MVAKPAHKVTITKPFYLGKYEVTQEQWEAVMGSNPSHFKGPKNPVEQVSWDDCQQFLVKLNAKIRRAREASSYCLRSRNGNMPVERGARANFVLGTTRNNLANMPGTTRTQATSRTL